MKLFDCLTSVALYTTGMAINVKKRTEPLIAGRVYANQIQYLEKQQQAEFSSSSRGSVASP